MNIIYKIAVLLTCYNRKQLTLRCIEQLKKQTLISRFHLMFYLVDDGCTDGTSLSVKEMYPDVQIIQGSGSLFWNGGMRLAWMTALKEKYDFYLWVNDDSMIYKDSILKMIESYEDLTHRNINVGCMLGTMVDPTNKLPTYGGRLRNSVWNPLSFGSVITPSNEPQECDFVNGNFTLIPASSVTKIGILSDAYTHSMGDFDYGLRLKKNGLSCWVAPGVYGECSINSEVGGCKDTSLEISKRLELMHKVSQLPPVDEWIYFVKAHGGFFWPFLAFKAWVRGRFPKLWILIRSKKI